MLIASLRAAHQVTIRRPAAVFPLLLVTVVGCGDASDARPSAGAAHWSVAPDPLVTIGLLDGSPEYVFSRIQAVRLFSDGGIVVADGASGTLRIFNPEGGYLRQLGGVGNGPGEFRYLASVTLAGDDTLRVYDLGTVRLTTFLVSGELVGTQAFRPTDGRPELYLGTFSDGTHALGWIRGSPIVPDRLKTDSMRIGRFSADGVLAGVLATSPGMRRLGSPAPLSPHLLVGMVGDSVVFTDGLGGIVRIVEPRGGRGRVLQLPGAGWTVEDALVRLAERLGTAELERLRRVRRTPGLDFVPDFSDMLIDRENRIWLKIYDPATDSHWRSRRRTGGEWMIVDIHGQDIARVRMPSNFRLMDVRGDRIAGIVRDEAEVERVRVYALDIGGSGGLHP